MNLEELLEYTAKQYLDDRVDLVDGEDDSIWSDAFLVRQLNEAQRIIARRAWCIKEYGVAPAGVIVLVTGKALYPLHKSVLHVYDATPESQTSPLGRTDDINLRSPNPPGADAFDVGENAALSGNITSSGTSVAFASDAASRTLRIYDTPTATQNGTRVLLKVARLPINFLTLDDVEGEPEVPEDWHMAMCEYAAGKALTLPNADSDNKVEGRRLLDAFDAVVWEARRQRQRAENNGERWSFCSTTAAIR